MTRADIIRMALDAGFTMDYPATERWIEMQTRFADLVASAERKDALKSALLKAKKITKMAVINEREACARECDLLQGSGENSDKWTITRVKAFHDSAAAIRARSQA